MTARVFASATEPGPLVLGPEESHYLVRVRRVRPGAMLEVLVPAGGGWSARLEDPDAKRARIELLAPLPPRPTWPIDLAVALPDAKAAYDVVARACEAGARSLTFVQTEHSQPARLTSARLQRVIAASRRQCGRLEPLPVREPQDLHIWLGTPRSGYVASLAPRAEATLAGGPLDVLIGPEGGLHPDEEARARDCGLLPLSLGPFVLRTEIAVTAAIAVVGTISGL